MSPNPDRRPLGPHELEAIRETQRAAASTIAPTGNTIGIDANGQPLDFRPQGFWAVLTADRTGNRYGWKITYPKEDGTLVTDTPGPETMHGSDTVWPAIEVDGRTDLVEGDGPFWLFPGAGAYFVFWGVEYANWTHKTGLVEDAWRGGLLSTGAQSLKGEKTLRDSLIVERPENAQSGGLSGGRVLLQSIGDDDLNTNGAAARLLTAHPTTPGASITSGVLVDALTGYGQLYLNTVYFTSAFSTSGVICDAAGGFMLNGSTSTAYGCRGLSGIDTEFEDANGRTLRVVGGIIVGEVASSPPPPPPPPPSGQGTLRVSVFGDDDEDGTRDAGEAGLAARLVTITGPIATGAITDANGYCDFVNLAPGKYAVTAALLGGETCATNGDEETVVADTLVDVERAVVLSPPPPTTGAVGIVVVKDGSEYLSRTVSISGPSPMSGTSAAYLYPLAAGDYTATVTPSGDTGTWSWSVPSQSLSGSGTTTDEFTCDGLTQVDVNFFLASPPPPPPPPPTGGVTGIIRDATGTPTPLLGVTVTLYSNFGVVLGSDVSDASTGAFDITGVSTPEYGCYFGVVGYPNSSSIYDVVTGTENFGNVDLI